MIKLDKENFDEVIKEGRVLVDFYADWCGPCRMFGPVFEEVSKDEDFNFVKLDVDKYSDIAREYGVMSIPTVILFENGNEVKRFTGFMSKDEFIEFLK